MCVNKVLVDVQVGQKMMPALFTFDCEAYMKIGILLDQILAGLRASGLVTEEVAKPIP